MFCPSVWHTARRSHAMWQQLKQLQKKLILYVKNQASKCLKTAKSAGHIDHIAVIIDFTIVFKNISDFVLFVLAEGREEEEEEIKPFPNRVCIHICSMCIGTVEHCSKVIPQNICLIAYRFVNRKQRQHSSCRLFRFSQRYAKNSNFQNQKIPTPRQMYNGNRLLFNIPMFQ